ncbi:MAG: VWA domain-containing protein [Rhodospirillales bacterium]|nr:VWA domain-containing protein [Rhodospirillales bacterium]
MRRFCDMSLPALAVAVHNEYFKDMMDKREKLPAGKSSASNVDAFLKKVAGMPSARAAGERGRLLFAMDATASRQPTWDRAAHIQGEMFTETAALGGLELQLAFFRGFGEFKASPWLTGSEELARMMTSVQCMAGETQIGKVLAHAINETKRRKIDALVYVGDCVEEDVDALGAKAGQLGLLGVPAFMFHEGDDALAAFAFKQIATLSGGAYCAFDASSAQTLKDLLGAVAVFAAGGRKALENMAQKRGGGALKLIQQVKGG